MMEEFETFFVAEASGQMEKKKKSAYDLKYHFCLTSISLIKSDTNEGGDT